MTTPSNQDYELFRIWDSCELEDFEENTHEYSFKFDSVNSEEQTGAMMILSLTCQVMCSFIHIQFGINICIYSIYI